MDLITRGLSTGLLIWFALLAAVIAGRILRGDIKTDGFMHTARGDGKVAPERVLYMAIFPVVLGMFALDALHAPLDPLNPSLPDLSDNMLMLLTGGNGLYLAGKIART